MNEIKDISWRFLPGNKFAKALDSAMDSDAGYVMSQRIRKKGQERNRICNVHYDRGYLIETFIRKIIKPLAVLGEERILELISQAWQEYHEYPTADTAESDGC